MSLDHLLDDVEAQVEAARGAFGAIETRTERLEDVRHCLGRDGSRVLDADDDALGVAAVDVYPDERSLIPALAGVLDEICERLHEAIGIP